MRYTHIQSNQDTTWVIKHNLGGIPTVTTQIISPTDHMVRTGTPDSIVMNDDNTLTITFSEPLAGVCAAITDGSNINDEIVDVVPYQTGVLSSTPVMYWPLHLDNDSTIAMNLINPSYDGQLNGVTVDQGNLTNDLLSNSVQFTNSNNIDISGTIGVLSSHGDLTVEGVCLLNDDTTNKTLVYIGGPASGLEDDNLVLQVGVNSNVLFISWEYSTGIVETTTSTVTLSPSQLYHIAVVKDSTNKEISFVIDGVITETISYTNEPTGGINGEAYIGNTPDGTAPFNGQLSDLSVYNYMLSGTTVNGHYLNL